VATIYRRPKADGSFTYWTKFRRDGVLVRTNTGTDNRAKAQKFLRDQIGAIEEGVAPNVDTRKVTYAQIRDNLLQDYETYRARETAEYMKRVRHLDSFFARHKAMQIAEDQIARYVKFRQSHLVKHADGTTTPTSNGTINRELAVLSKMLRLARRGRLLVHVPHITMLKESKPREGFVDADQFERVRKNLEPDLQLVAVIGYTYGCRLQEVLGLDWERNIDWEAREIVLLETKNDERRSLPFTEEVEVLLRKQRARIRVELGRVTDCVFPLLPGDHVRPKYLGTRRLSITRAWKQATKAAGVPGLLFHDLRRSGVRNLVRAGVSPQVAMTISGHKTASVFARYNITNADDRRAAMAKVQAFQRNGGAA
jgi:integrase